MGFNKATFGRGLSRGQAIKNVATAEFLLTRSRRVGKTSAEPRPNTTTRPSVDHTDQSLDRHVLEVCAQGHHVRSR